MRRSWKRVVVESQIFERYDGCNIGVVLAENFENGPSDAVSIGLLRAAEDSARKSFQGEPATSHAHIRAWRSAYSQFGAKPSDYFSSAESLLRRVLRGEEIPAINRAVDAYNAISVDHVLPAGGEDLLKVRGDLRLYFATGTELFDAAAGDVDHPAAGEVVWGDTAGVTCRRWNWRQGVRTRLTDETTSAVFVLECLSPFTAEGLRRATDDLVASLRALCPAARLESSILGE